MHTQSMPEAAEEIKAPAQKPTPDLWYRRYARDYYEGTRELKLDERGAYSDILDLIYMAGGPLKDDERIIAHKLCIHVNKWRKMRARLLALGKLYLARGYLHNAKAKQVLATRQSEKEAMGRKGVTRGDTGGDTPRVSGGVSGGGTQGDMFKNPNNNKDDFGASSQHRTEEKRREEESNIIPLRASQKVEGLAGLNGAVAPMLKDIAGWMGGVEEERAREWLGKQIAIYGETVVRNSYSKLSTDIAAGGRRLVARPLQTWCGIAARMHAGAGDEPATTATSYQDQRTRADMEWGKIRRQLAGESE